MLQSFTKTIQKVYFSCVEKYLLQWNVIQLLRLNPRGTCLRILFGVLVKRHPNIQCPINTWYCRPRITNGSYFKLNFMRNMWQTRLNLLRPAQTHTLLKN